MKEFIEKLIGRLEEEYQSQHEKYTKSLGGGNLVCIYDKTDIEGAKVGSAHKMIEIVKGFAEEYSNESCKGDLISKSAFLKLLNDYVSRAYDCGGIDDENVIEYQQTHDDKSEYIIQGFGEVYGLLEDVPTTHIDGWIPCSEKYPEDNQTVLTIDSEGNMEVLDYDTNWENSFCKYGGTVKVFNIIAWQRLPEPYKTEGE